MGRVAELGSLGGIDTSKAKNKMNTSTTTTDITAVSKRYADAYKVAKVIVIFSTVTRILGLIAAAGVFFYIFSILGGAEASDHMVRNVAVAAVGAVLSWFVFYIIAVVIGCQGQLLRAAVDVAVFSCPSLSDDQRLQIAGLR